MFCCLHTNMYVRVPWTCFVQHKKVQIHKHVNNESRRKKIRWHFFHLQWKLGKVSRWWYSVGCNLDVMMKYVHSIFSHACPNKLVCYFCSFKGKILRRIWEHQSSWPDGLLYAFVSLLHVLIFHFAKICMKWIHQFIIQAEGMIMLTREGHK